MRTRRTLIRSALAAGAAILSVTLAIASRSQPPPEQRPPEDELWISPARFAAGAARVAAAGEADLPQALVLGGRIDFDDLRVTHVFSPVSGRVTRVLARLGQEVRAFAAPYGALDERIARLAAGCGYHIGFSTRTAWARLGDPPLMLPRIEVRGEWDLDTFAEVMKDPR